MTGHTEKDSVDFTDEFPADNFFFFFFFNERSGVFVAAELAGGILRAAAT